MMQHVDLKGELSWSVLVLFGTRCFAPSRPSRIACGIRHVGLL